MRLSDELEESLFERPLERCPLGGALGGALDEEEHPHLDAGVRAQPEQEVLRGSDMPIAVVQQHGLPDERVDALTGLVRLLAVHLGGRDLRVGRHGYFHLP